MSSGIVAVPVSPSASSGALSEVILEDEDAYLSVQGIANCFYELGIPLPLRQRFGLRALPAAAGITHLDGL